MPENTDNRFRYETYEKNIFATREELTALSKIILDTKTGTLSLIVNFVKITALLALFKIRKNMYDEELLHGKQIYERNAVRDNREELRRDDRDETRRE